VLKVSGGHQITHRGPQSSDKTQGQQGSVNTQWTTEFRQNAGTAGFSQHTGDNRVQTKRRDSRVQTKCKDSRDHSTHRGRETKFVRNEMTAKSSSQTPGQIAVRMAYRSKGVQFTICSQTKELIDDKQRTTESSPYAQSEEFITYDWQNRVKGTVARDFGLWFFS
jgi:hypothetical protein